jgi:hypothetical protein
MEKRTELKVVSSSQRKGNKKDGKGKANDPKICFETFV